MLKTVQRSALLTYSAAQMYQLVNDVASYPQFMAGCSAAEILEQGPGFMVARLELSQGRPSYSFTTRNSLRESESITMELVEGPFTFLSGEWTFAALAERACKVSLKLEFEFNSMAVSLITSGLFSRVANDLLDAVVKRAALLYGTNHG